METIFKATHIKILLDIICCRRGKIPHSLLSMQFRTSGRLHFGQHSGVTTCSKRGGGGELILNHFLLSQQKFAFVF